MYIPRAAEQRLRRYLELFPCVAVTGPRQSGKTTLVRHCLPELPYVSFDDPDEELALNRDPKGFLARFDGPVILDEVQRVPVLQRYLKLVIDAEPSRNGRFILTGSNQLLLQKSLSESLAGRIGLLQLLPLERQELPERLKSRQLLLGGYPALAARDYTGAREWFAAYLSTYLERDVRLVHDIGKLTDFQILVRLLAARCSQESNASSLAKEIGVSSHTVDHWISVLQAGYVGFALQPFHANLGKRLIKRPKLYFWDTGLACHLTGLRDREALEGGPLHGPLFENLVVAELRKHALHAGLDQDFWFYRDGGGTEIDLIIHDHDHGLVRCMEIKTGMTPKPDWAYRLQKAAALIRPGFPEDHALVCEVVYQGESRSDWPRPGVDFVNLEDIF